MNVQHWESYYRSGALISCPTGPEPRYTREVHAAWLRFFADVADGERVLDLGTGNGAVALIAREAAAARGIALHIDGIDLAAIDPRRDVPGGDDLFEGIRFHAGIDAGALPFDDDAFAAISGQYIVEYTDVAKTLAECRRVLAPGGRCQFIVHHLHSDIVRNAIESLRQADVVIHETQTLRKFRRYCELAAERPLRARGARRHLYAAGERLQAAARASLNPLLLDTVIREVSALLANRRKLTRGELLRQSFVLERELADWVARLQDLVAAAMSADEIEALLRAASAAGFADARHDVQFQNDTGVVGWLVTLGGPA